MVVRLFRNDDGDDDASSVKSLVYCIIDPHAIPCVPQYGFSSVRFAKHVTRVAYRPRFGGDSQARTPQLA
jgi:hypothetical protein